jgi:signal transduction histidine kinase/CheY-like chemotaxis protein/HPt (histidine-containing phosphotransfer) domain-containing protein
MDHQNSEGDVFRSSPLMILITYTVLGVALIAETILMSWELWAIPIIAASIIICWGLHITQFMSHKVRLYISTMLMMVCYFFYGIHITSTYDMPLLMMLIIMIFTTTGEVWLVTACQITYYFTLVYDIIAMISMDTEWDSLLISRTALHVVLMFMCGWLARIIIKKWDAVFHRSDNKIKELNDSTKRMNSFMANLSHELRTPINAILGITSVMVEKENSEELKADMHEVVVAGRRMAEQVGDILDYSEIEMNQLVVNKGSYMIASILNDLVVELRPIIPDNLELVIDVDAEVPAVLKGDSGKLHKILYHLISNGLKYTKDGGVLVHITSIKQKYGVNLCIDVSDTGIGMSKDELDRLYSRFYQAESGRIVRSGGLGISMVIVSGFVRSLGGFITIDSIPEKGTVVRISIPQEVEDDGRCMSVNNKEVLNLAGFLNIGKFSNPNVREYYNSMILNLVRGLRVTMHRVDNISDLKKLLQKVPITHLFVADEEYVKNFDYIESLNGELKVVVVAKESFKLPKGAKAHILLKPFYCIPIASILNSDHTKKDEEKRMYCKGVRALVVDDEPMNLNVAKGIFKRYGMEVSTADSGAEAVKMCKEQTYDIVFMDHMMPGMDGVETMKRIRYDAGKHHRDFPIVALTANALSTAREMFIAEGFDGFISKPIELAELERVLRHVLSKTLITYVDENEDALGTINGKLISENEADDAWFVCQNGDTNTENTSTPNDTVSDTPIEDLDDSISLAPLADYGIDINLGLKYCQDGEIYMSLLEQYAQEFDEKLEGMEDFYKKKDLENYTILVHALKSTSLMIGDKSLSEEAKALELAGKNRDLEFIEKNHRAMTEHYTRTAQGIAKVLKVKDTDEDDFEILEFPPEG